MLKITMDNDKKVGRPGRFYSLTPKAHEFIEALENWCAESGIDKEAIPKLLRHMSFIEYGKFIPEEAFESIASLVEKGYLKEVE